jgi:hypothetical protein
VAPIETAKREPPLSAEERWRRDAQRFAEEHDGVLVEQPMTKGLATISNLDGLTPIPFGAERPFLGPGKIRAGSESYYFGNGFHGSPAAKFHEIPGLAKELGVNSVTVVLEPVDKNYRLVLHWEPLSVVDANTEAEVTKLRKLQEAIKECLPLIGAHISSEKERAEAQKTLMQLVGVEPPVAPKRDDPRFVHDAQAWDEALDTYRQECRKLLSKLPTLGQHRSLALGYQIDRVYRNALIEHSKRIDADLRSRVTQISAVLYRSIGKVEIPAAAATQSDRLAEIGGQFDETAEDAPAPGFIAQVKPRIVADPHGIPMPPSTWAAQKLLVKCVFTPAGGQPIVKEGAVQFEPADIPPGTEKMSVRFRFFRQGIFDGEDPQLIAETQAFVLKTIRPRQQYTITFRMSEEGLRALRDPNTASRPANF